MVFADTWVEKKEGRFLIYKDVKGRANSAFMGEVFAEFWHGYTHHRSNIELTEVGELVFLVGDAEIPPTMNEEYAINVDEGGFAVVSDSKEGLIRGFITLLDRIHPTDDEGAIAYIDCGVIRESARIATRMVHFCVFPETDLFHFRRFLRFAAALKYTHVIIEFWGMIKFDCMAELAWPFAFSKDEIRPIIAEVRELGVEVVPMFNHWGHAALSRAIHGKHVILDQNPTLVMLFDEGGWCWKISEGRVRELLGKIREELMDLCGEGSYFHIGCDEADGYDMSNPELMVGVCDFVNQIADDLERHGRRPIMWGDMMLYNYPHYNKDNKYCCGAPSVECEKYVFEKLNKRIIIADWQYLAKVEPVETSLTVKSYGYDCLVCPFSCGFAMTNATINTVADHGLMGFIHTTWHTLSTGTPYVTMAAISGYAKLSSDEKTVRNHAEISSADTLRKVLPAGGVYEHAGWSRKQTGDFIT